MRSRIRRSLPVREQVFAQSLMYHGYRYTGRRHLLKKKKGYIIPSTKREDAAGVDFWIKARGTTAVYPIQITQRGVGTFRRKNQNHTPEQLGEFIRRSDLRLRRKRAMCRSCKIAFVLVRDYLGPVTNKRIAWGDIKALHYGLARVRT